jgi:hypothetical protein
MTRFAFTTIVADDAGAVTLGCFPITTHFKFYGGGS